MEPPKQTSHVITEDENNNADYLNAPAWNTWARQLHQVITQQVALTVLEVKMHVIAAIISHKKIPTDIVVQICQWIC